jgi:hypothetical protein
MLPNPNRIIRKIIKTKFINKISNKLNKDKNNNRNKFNRMFKITLIHKLKPDRKMTLWKKKFNYRRKKNKK